jgi:large subunit ribosomal protein L25
MEKITLNAEMRAKVGKGAARTLRRAGSVPAVLYREGQSHPITLNYRELSQALKATAGEQVVVSLKFPQDEKLALLKDYQTDPARGDLLHVDFFEVSLKEKVRVTVPVSTVGEPIGVKRDKGILQHSLREIEVECLPDRIPGHIEVDVSGMLTGNAIHVSDLAVPEEVKVLTDPGEVIAILTAPVIEEAAPAAEAPPPEAEAPEVVKKGKEGKEAEEEKEKEKS